MILSRSLKDRVNWAQSLYFKISLKLKLKSWIKYWGLKTFYPLVNEKFVVPETRHTSCVSCGWCLIVCPVDVISLVTSHPPVANQQDLMERIGHPKRPELLQIDASHCLSCGQCLDVCPTDALSFPKQVLEVDQSEISPTQKEKVLGE